MRIILPQQIADDADVVSTNLVDTRYDEWDDEGVYERADRVRVSAQRSEYEALTDHDNSDDGTWLFRVRSGGIRPVYRSTIVTSGIDEEEDVELTVEPNDALSSTQSIFGIAYDDTNKWLWLAIARTTRGSTPNRLTAFPYRVVGGNLIRVRNREITLDTDFDGNYASLDVIGTKLIAAYKLSIHVVATFDITSTGGTEDTSARINNISSQGRGAMAATEDYIFIWTSSGQRQVKVYDRVSTSELTTWELNYPAAADGITISWTGILALDDVFYIADSEGMKAFDIGSNGLVRNTSKDIATGDLDNVGGSTSQLEDLDLALNLIPDIKSPVVETEAIESRIIPDPDPRNWARIGATMPWRLFDKLPAQQAQRAASIEMRVKLKGTVDAVALLNLTDCSQVTIAVTRGATSLHNKNYAVPTPEAQTAWEHVLSSTMMVATRLLVKDLPDSLQNDDEMTVTFTGGSSLGCGQLVFGPAFDFGKDGLLPTASKVNVFGATTVVENILDDPEIDAGLEGHTITMASTLDLGEVDGALKAIRLLRGDRQALWIGSDEDAIDQWTYGFIRSVGISYPNPNQATLSVTLQEVT